MTGILRWFAGAALAVALVLPASAAMAQEDRARMVIQGWYRLVLELVRHTPTYSPPVASRSFAYLGTIAWEAQASADPALHSLAGQLNDLAPLPARAPGRYDEALVLHAALGMATRDFFGNTGPTGQRAMDAMQARLQERLVEGLPEDVVARSIAHGMAVAGHVGDWSSSDGGAVVANMGFPAEFTARNAPEAWVPTSLIAQQQAPLLPGWGNNRTFAMPDGTTCPVPPPPPYDETPGSGFHDEARAVVEATAALTADQREIALFWADDPMLSPTPPGHWVAIALAVLAEEDADALRHADVLARLGVAMADGLIGCWQAKFAFDLLRPVTYINRVIDPDWRPILTTPPFPEYPSGHSTQSAAAATVLTAAFGAGYAFTDRTHEDDGLAARSFPDFHTAAAEAGMSRLYGGIHFPAAITRGLEQGRCIGAHAAALRTRS